MSGQCSTRSIRGLGALLAILAIPLGIGWFHSRGVEAEPLRAEKTESPVPLFAETTSAKNPTKLHLQVDDDHVHGWISGTKSFAGQEVTINANEQTRRATVDEENTFAWSFDPETTSSATFTLGGMKQTLTLPEAITRSPCVFFVVDRTVYRPGQMLQFAGFLRRLNAEAEFEPLVDETVTVALTSVRKDTKATELVLTSDEMGRITGAYTFSDADPLDEYRLTIADYKGEARLKLAEYRKSKIKLKIDGQTEQDKLNLKFEVVDFLEKPVEGTKVSFTAQVIRKQTTSEKSQALNPEEFAYYEPASAEVDLWESLPEDVRLLWRAEGIVPPYAWGQEGDQVVAQISQEIQLQGKEPGEYELDIERDWRKGNHSVAVQAVVLDANGREQRASQVFPISQTQSARKLHLPKTLYSLDETIRVKLDQPLKESSSLVVMRLSPSTSTAVYPQYNYRHARLNYLLNARGHAGFRGRGGYWNPGWVSVAPSKPAERELVTAVPFHDGVAEVKLTEPGAYKLVAVTPGEDGLSERSEVGCVVQPTTEMKGLILSLDSRELKSGDRLRGTLHSRFRDARVLLTIRDSSGIRATKTLQVKGSVLRIDEPLPSNMRYGASVDVAYLDAEGITHLSQAFFHVVPNDRILTVDASIKEEVQPGEKVSLDLQVNREEPVDLVVSVYDQALLGIAPDQSVDVRNFFLADDRVRTRLSKELVHRQLGGIDLRELADRAKKMLEDVDGQLLQTPFFQTLTNLEHAVSTRTKWHLTSRDVANVLQLAGIDVLLDPRWFSWYGHNWTTELDFSTNEPINVGDVLAKQGRHDWSLHCAVVHGSLIIRETHPSYANRPLAQLLPQTYYFNSFNPGWGYYGNNSFLPVLGNTYRGRARGDSHFSVTGNSAYSISGQSFLSHVPAPGAAPIPLIDTDVDQGHISVRRDFSDSAFWNARVRTDETGHAKVEFQLPDSLTNWQVVVTAISKDMHVGQTKTRFRTNKPVMVWPMIPRVFTEGDTVEVFASVHNRTDSDQDIKVRLKVENGEVLTAPEHVVRVPAQSNAPVYWTFQPREAGFTQLLMTADCPLGSDASLKRLPVTPAGAEQVITASGVCREGATITIPKGVNPESARLEITLAPSLAADMADSLDYLVSYPYGCVEQTMSRFLPTLEVAKILQRYHIDHPTLAKKVPHYVNGGIKRLLELQHGDGGWGWHGNGQSHEMMTPYALYGLLKAEKAGYTIPNENAVNAGLSRLQTFIQSMGEAQATDRIYCMYVYAHRRDILPDWWKFIADMAEKDKLSDYALALALEMAVQKDRQELTDLLAPKLRDRAERENGRVWWTTAGFSRWGNDPLEITAAVMKALVAYDKDDPLIDGILTYFARTKQGNRWNSTKSTAMILYAMCDYLAQSQLDSRENNTITVAVNDAQSEKVLFDDGLSKKVTILGTQLKTGVNYVRFETKMAGVMYRLAVRYWQRGADLKPMEDGIKVTRNLYLLDGKGNVQRQLKSGDRVPRGSYLLSEVIAQHVGEGRMSYVLVEDFKPSCGEYLPVDDPRFAGNQSSTTYALREERTAYVAFHHEQTGANLNDRSVILAELAGRYHIPPARVELMYDTETRGHSGNFVLNVVEE